MARREPARITSAARARSEELYSRERRYLISMGVRTACFVAAVAVFLTVGADWLMWVLVVASFVLPYVAVVMANAGGPIDTGQPEFFDPDRKALERGRDEPSPEDGR